MKKFIPILSIITGAVCLQHCTQRDENLISENEVKVKSNHVVNGSLLKQDSTQSTSVELEPDPKDPPVRDGDNWRAAQSRN